MPIVAEQNTPPLENPVAETHGPDIHSVVHAYLATLLAIADALETACPAVGGPHQQRLGRLRTRLSFDSNTKAIEASSLVVRSELQDFAANASRHVAIQTEQWKFAAQEVRSLGAGLVKRQRYYATRLREQATRLPSEQAGALLNCAESMDNEAQSLLSRMNAAWSEVETRLAEAEVVDAATGLMNRREMERRLQRCQDEQEQGVRLRYRITCEGATGSLEGVLRQAGIRLTAQLRPEDLVARWDQNEFMVLFRAPLEIAERRGVQIAELINGTYRDGNGSVEVRAEVLMPDAQLAHA